MNRKIVARVAAGVLFLLLGFVAYTQNQNQPPKLTLNKSQRSPRYCGPIDSTERV